MSLTEQVTVLATRLANEIKARVRPDHPGLARAWAHFGYVGGGVELRAAHNVASVTRLGTGRFQVTFATPFEDTNYCWVASGRSNATTGTIRFAAARTTTDGKTTTRLDIVCVSSTGSLADTSEINLVVYR
jgi:hypothetical protein